MTKKTALDMAEIRIEKLLKALHEITNAAGGAEQIALSCVVRAQQAILADMDPRFHIPDQNGGAK